MILKTFNLHMRHFFALTDANLIGHKSPADRAKELFKPLTMRKVSLVKFKKIG